MATYQPPTENINQFNTTLFTNSPTGTGLTKTQADTYYLSKLNNDTSTASLTTFNGQVSMGNMTCFPTGINQGIDCTQWNGSLIFTTYNVSGIANTSLTLNSLGTTIGTNILTLGNAGTTLSINSSASLVSIFNSFSNQTVNFCSNLVSGIINFCSTGSTSMFNLNAKLLHRQIKYLNQNKIITTTTATLAFPLEENIILTAIGNITITLPLVNSSNQVGMKFYFANTASITNSTTFTAQGTNMIVKYGSITQVSSVIMLNTTYNTAYLLITEPTAGNFVWVEI